MKFQATEIIRGFSMFDGTIDGTKIESGSFHIDVKLDEKGGKGYRTEAMRSTIEVVRSVAHNEFPMKAVIDVEQTATKKGTQLVIVGVKPLEVQTPLTAQRKAA